MDIVSHSILVLLTERQKIPVQPINKHRIRWYLSGFNIKRKTTIFFEDNLESIVIVMNRLIRLLFLSTGLGKLLIIFLLIPYYAHTVIAQWRFSVSVSASCQKLGVSFSKTLPRCFHWAIFTPCLAHPHQHACGLI